MERKKAWKDFQTLVDARPDYRAYLYCQDSEEKALRQELISLVTRLNGYAAAVRQVPMPEELDDVHLSRSSAHIDQHIASALFIETLFENCLRQGSDEDLNLLFAFLETYSGLLEEELHWCEQQNIPPDR